jgi:hypothetical protein
MCEPHEMLLIIQKMHMNEKKDEIVGSGFVEMLTPAVP